MDTASSLEMSFYQKLGRLFYAVAAADKVVHQKEFETLKELVKDHWTAASELEDSFHSHAAFQIEIVFDWLEYQHLPASEAFKDFKYFLKEHPSLFTDDRKKRIWNTANAIAGAFSGKNKSELIMLTKLQLALSKVK